MSQDLAAELNALTSHDNPTDTETRYQISVHSKFRMNWDIMMMCFILYVCIVAPVRIGFFFDATGFWFGFEIAIDIFFLIDILLNFRTTYIDDDSKEEVTDNRQIAVHYLRTDFCLDLVSSVPVQLLALANIGGGAAGGGLQYGSFLKLCRILKLVRAVRAGEVFKTLQKEMNANPAVFRMIKFICIFLFLIHLIACVYRFFIFEAHDAITSNIGNMTVMEEYSLAFHFSLAAASGNNMAPSSTSQEVWMSIFLLIGFVINATIIGSATNLLANLDSTAVAKKAQIDGINEYLRFRKVPQQLQQRIQTYYEYLWDSGKSSYNQGLLIDLPEKLRVLLNLTLKKSLISKVPLFKALSPPAVIAVVQKLRHLIVLPDELIVAQGEEADSMFFIARGSVRIYVHSNGKDVYLVTLGEGSFFGEIALLSPEATRSANVRAISFCELEVMYRVDFEGLLEAFPRFRTAVENLSKARLRVSESVSKQGKAGNKLGIDPDEQYRKQRRKRLIHNLPKVMGAFGGKQARINGFDDSPEEMLDQTGSIGLQNGKDKIFESIMKNQKFLSIQTATSIFQDKGVITPNNIRRFEGVLDRHNEKKKK
eukprot:CAMPEP_0117744714 /NCGR_PEP_ID=MMETSP0947-20121206/6927_1 /TAXON_ID=44440 /ORGANISM="Chattonella subsalsa, Strain CCMP2191" /LENGTH=594 /DNA_ID=CAMNT_0005561723 /DNA_START=341 /DNA_END=2125 /DNA_ORIENTATION=+